MEEPSPEVTPNTHPACRHLDVPVRGYFSLATYRLLVGEYKRLCEEKIAVWEERKIAKEKARIELTEIKLRIEELEATAKSSGESDVEEIEKKVFLASKRKSRLLASCKAEPSPKMKVEHLDSDSPLTNKKKRKFHDSISDDDDPMLRRIRDKENKKVYLEKRSKLPELFEVACTRCAKSRLRCQRQLDGVHKYSKAVCVECSMSRIRCSFSSQAFHGKTRNTGEGHKAKAGQISDLVSLIDTLGEKLGDQLDVGKAQSKTLVQILESLQDK